MSYIICLTRLYSLTVAFIPCILVKSASHYSKVGTLAAVTAAKGVGLQGGAQGVIVIGGIGAEIVLNIQLVIK